MNKYFLDYSFGIEIIFNQLSKCNNYDDKYYYSITESNDAVYITFRTSKKCEDWFSNMKILPSYSRDIIDGYTHFGFTKRANSVNNIEEIYTNATKQGKYLIIGGHSLGGAAASICAFNLLKNHFDSDKI